MNKPFATTLLLSLALMFCMALVLFLSTVYNGSGIAATQTALQRIRDRNATVYSPGGATALPLPTYLTRVNVAPTVTTMKK